MSFKTISVFGLGYIGLPTAAVLASRKVKVIGVDVNVEAVDKINKGEVHIVEPDLDIVVHAVVREGYLRAVKIPEPADAFLIAVPTPFKGDHEPDLSYIEAACKSIATVLKKGDLVILESTSPVGATEKMGEWLAESRPDLTFPNKHKENSDIRIAHCPERVLPGRVLHELVHNDRVIGGLSNKCSEKAVELYKIFVEGECIVTDAKTAEMAKLTENSFRDVNIAFANELSLICEEQGINVWELIELANRHPRVNILQPGPGVGGHCIAVDPWFIVSASPDKAHLIKCARKVNDYKPCWVHDQVVDAIDGISNPVVACLGLSFKADIDDLRESPAVEIVRKLSGSVNGWVLAVEPNIERLPDSLSNASNIKLTTLKEAIEKANVIVVLVDHKEFIQAKLSEVISKDQYVIDSRGIV